MQNKIQALKEQFAIHSRNLTDLESKKAQYGPDVPIHIKREIEQEEKEISSLNGKIMETNNSLIQKLNEIRNQIIIISDEYIQLSSKLSDFENLFLSYVLLPGYQLNQTIQKRNYLEREYNRIRAAIEKGVYKDSEEIEGDIRKTLKHAEVAFAYKETEPTDAEKLDEGVLPMSPTSTLGKAEPFNELDETTKQNIVKDFKKIVLPRVHADTADAPFEVFNTAYEAYKKRDYLIMEALIIKYRGELDQTVEEPIIFLDQVTNYFHTYPRVQEGLERRLLEIEEDATTQRLENPEEVKIQLKKQNKEIRRATYEEAERILYLRSCFEDLVGSRPLEKEV